MPARLARHLGSAAITRACARYRTLGFASYDRLFPSQDTLPKGGFGNLIALPLQREARGRGATVFVDEAWRPYPDQWAFLAAVDRLTSLTVESILARAEKEDGILGVRSVSIGDDVADDPWTLPPSRREFEPRLTGPFPRAVEVVSANMLFVDKAGLPEQLLNRLSRLAAFQNPEFYQAQALRFSTFGKPRIIGCAEDFPRHLALPRGCADEVFGLLEECGIELQVQDKRHEAEVMLLRAKLAEALRVWMEREGLTQAKAAKRLGITQPRVSEITRGKVELLSLDYLVGLCAKAGIAVGVRLAA